MAPTRDLSFLFFAALSCACAPETVPAAASHSSAAAGSKAPIDPGAPPPAAAVRSATAEIAGAPPAASPGGVAQAGAGAANTAARASGSGTNSNLAMPPTVGGFDYQLAGRYPADARVKVVSSDANINADPSKPAAADQPLDKGSYNICYLNVLQTQADDYDYWIGKHPDLILKNAAGEPLHDPDPEWARELLFDISTQAKRGALLALQKSWIARCAADGFKAIEPDNLDAYERSQGALTAEDAQSFMQMFVTEAHTQGLAVAQKNVAEWVSELGVNGKPRAAAVGFDFAIIEECQLTGECDKVIDHYGAARVFEIEYVYDTDDDSSGVRVAANSVQHFTMACAARGGSVRIVLRNRDVRPATGAGYVFQLCDQAATSTGAVMRTTTATMASGMAVPAGSTPARSGTAGSAPVGTGTAGSSAASAGTGGSSAASTGRAGSAAPKAPPRTTMPTAPTTPTTSTTPRTTTPSTPPVTTRTTTPTTPSAPPRKAPATPPVAGTSRPPSPTTSGAGGNGSRMNADAGIADDDDDDDDDYVDEPGTRGAAGVGASGANEQSGAGADDEADSEEEPGWGESEGAGDESTDGEVDTEEPPSTEEESGSDEETEP